MLGLPSLSNRTCPFSLSRAAPGGLRLRWPTEVGPLTACAAGRAWWPSGKPAEATWRNHHAAALPFRASDHPCHAGAARRHQPARACRALHPGCRRPAAGHADRDHGCRSTCYRRIDPQRRAPVASRPGQGILPDQTGRHPETTYNANGGAITTLSVATTSKWKDKNTGESARKRNGIAS